MKSVISKTDQLGRILIPKQMRVLYEINKEFTHVELVPMKNGILIKRISNLS